MTIKRKTLRFKNFYDLKKQAYKIALKSKGQKDGSQWIKNHINMYYPSSNTRHFEKIIEVYRKYLDNEITLNQAKQVIENIEDEFDGTMNMLQNIFNLSSAKSLSIKNDEYRWFLRTFVESV